MITTNHIMGVSGTAVGETAAAAAAAAAVCRLA